jgi:hypothetical protein
VIAGGFYVEAVVVGDRAADGAADEGERSGGQGEDKGEEGRGWLVLVAKDPHGDAGQDQHGNAEHGPGMSIYGPAGLRSLFSVARSQSQNPVKAVNTDTIAPPISVKEAAR